MLEEGEGYRIEFKERLTHLDREMVAFATGTRSLLRNPNLANLFHRIGLIEKMGTGIQRIQNLIHQADLQPVDFKFSDFVSVIFYRQTTMKSSEKSSEKILALIRENHTISASEIAQKINLSARAVEKHISGLKKAGKLRRKPSASHVLQFLKGVFEHSKKFQKSWREVGFL